MAAQPQVLFLWHEHRVDLYRFSVQQEHRLEPDRLAGADVGHIRLPGANRPRPVGGAAASSRLNPRAPLFGASSVYLKVQKCLPDSIWAPSPDSARKITSRSVTLPA